MTMCFLFAPAPALYYIYDNKTQECMDALAFAHYFNNLKRKEHSINHDTNI